MRHGRLLLTCWLFEADTDEDEEDVDDEEDEEEEEEEEESELGGDAWPRLNAELAGAIGLLLLPALAAAAAAAAAANWCESCKNEEG